MAQHDYVIDNQSFPATRTDLNNVLQAIVSNNSGSSAPSTTFANQIWYDSSANILYIRNEDNDANIPLMQFDQSADVAATLATVIDILDASGTNQAGTALTIRGGAGTGTGAGGSIILQTADGGSSGSSVNSHATVVTITDDGKVGVGDTTPETPIEISVANKLGSTFTGTTAGEGLRVTQSSFSSGNFVSLVEAPHQQGGVPNVRIGAMFDGGGSNLAIGTSNSYGSGITNTAMFIHSSGNMQLSGGLSFAGDDVETAANALDDYEEGTWTPVYQGLSSNPTVTHSVQIGRFVKVGQFVNVMFRIQTTAASGGSGALLIGGLPFACTNVSSLFATGSVGFSSGFTTFAPQTLLVTANGQTIQLIRNSGTNGYDGLATSITTSELSNASGANDCIGSISYRTD